MARIPTERVLQPSLLDRLIDLEPANRSEAHSVRALSLAELKNSVRRDLVWLLNSRRTPFEPPLSARRLWQSVYCYGLPDITGLSFNSAEDHTRLARTLETVIATYETRLMNAKVTLQESSTANRLLHFQIEALLRTEPVPARVYFDTTLELTSGEYDVRGESNAR